MKVKGIRTGPLLFEELLKQRKQVLSEHPAAVSLAQETKKADRLYRATRRLNRVARPASGDFRRETPDWMGEAVREQEEIDQLRNRANDVVSIIGIVPPLDGVRGKFTALMI
ncbi:hypothetical protein BV898_09253 [Hypsibius exemplaris]|uniref:Uncharacterized protein n=1 Tax=Hypsibius exemplaris TaxID=2072580 RepID=A0A1W0WMY8_HYPEX|nr:hypothetical protein BV898_09253 [Hypsibius exemplaris]